MFTPLALGVLLAFAPAVTAKAKSRSAKEKIDRTPQTLVIIWGGGNNPSDADAAADDFTKRGFSSSAPLAKVLSTTIPGLKPGFHIAVLGACAKDRAHSILRRARRFYPGVYLRTVPKTGIAETWPCPKIKTPKQEWYFEPSPEEAAHITGDETVTSGANTLQVKVTADIESNGEYVAAAYEVTATLSRAGAVIDTQTISARDFSTVQELEVDGNSIVLNSRDGLSDCKSDSFYEMQSVTRRFSLKGDQIQVKEKVTRTESGLCGPNYEGSTPCSVAQEQALVAAVGSACDGATRAVCMAAIAKYEKTAKPVACSDVSGDSGGDGGYD